MAGGEESDERRYEPMRRAGCGDDLRHVRREDSAASHHDNSHKYFIRPKGNTPNQFGVHHYATDTIYNTEGWLEKNSDPLKDEAKTAVQQARYPGGLFRTLLDNADTAPSDGSNRKRTSVSKDAAGSRARSASKTAEHR